MSENTETKQIDHITTLRSLISPPVLVACLSLTDEEIAAQFVTVSEEFGVSASYIRASFRQLVQRMSRAIARKSSPRVKPLQETPLEEAIKNTKKGKPNLPG